MISVATQLGGATEVIGFSPDFEDGHRSVSAMIVALNNCADHHGVHHFAVIQQGSAIAMSPVGKACLIGQGFPL